MPSRPNSRPRANSQDSVRDVVNVLRSPTTVQAEKERQELVYLFEVTLRDSEKKVYKVGRTYKTMADRENNIMGKCHHDAMRPVPELCFQHTSHAALAETLFKAEFKAQVAEFPCTCGTQRHTEYFDISHDVAVEALTRWREFCAKRPWDLKTNQLLPFWDDRLRSWEHGFARAGRQDQKAIAASWRRFTEPVFWDCALFDGRKLAGSLFAAFLLLVLAIWGIKNPFSVSLNVVTIFLVSFAVLVCYCSTLQTTKFLCENPPSWLCAGLQDEPPASISNEPSEQQMEGTSAVVSAPSISSDPDVQYVGERRLSPSERRLSPVF